MEYNYHFVQSKKYHSTQIHNNFCCLPQTITTSKKLSFSNTMIAKNDGTDNDTVDFGRFQNWNSSKWWYNILGRTTVVLVLFYHPGNRFRWNYFYNIYNCVAFVSFRSMELGRRRSTHSRRIYSTYSSRHHSLYCCLIHAKCFLKYKKEWQHRAPSNTVYILSLIRSMCLYVQEARKYRSKYIIYAFTYDSIQQI